MGKTKDLEGNTKDESWKTTRMPQEIIKQIATLHLALISMQPKHS
jgi:hypothetical protein